MKKTISIAAAILGIVSCSIQADAKLTYELSGPDMQTHTKSFSLARFFARIDDPADPDSYLLYQTGKFFPLYEVKQSANTYRLLTPVVTPTLHAGTDLAAAKKKSASADKPNEAVDPEAQPPVEASSPAKPTAKEDKAIPVETNDQQAKEASGKPTPIKPELKLRMTKKTRDIAGVTCRVIEEMAGEQPIMTHCMAEKVQLGISEREIRSLARLFRMARERNLGWLGATTHDETFFSIASTDLQSHKTLLLKSISTQSLPEGYLRIPKSYRQITTE